MIEATVNVKPSLERVKKKLLRARRAMANVKPAKKKAAIFLDQWVQKNFKSEGGNVGGWKPFKLGGRVTSRQDRRFTVNVRGGRRSRVDTTAKLLQDTGRLRLSYFPFVRGDRIGVGSKIKYSKRQDEMRRTLPKNKDVAKPISKIFDNHTKKVSKRFN